MLSRYFWQKYGFTNSINTDDEIPLLLTEEEGCEGDKAAENLENIGKKFN